MSDLMQELRDFLLDRFGEEAADAEAAQKADPGPWTVEPTLAASTNERHNFGAGLVVAADDVALWDCEGTNLLCMTAPTSIHVARWDPAAVLAEIEAKRIIVESCRYGLSHYGDHSALMLAEDILRRLGTLYDKHPAYKPAWAPDQQIY